MDSEPGIWREAYKDGILTFRRMIELAVRDSVIKRRLPKKYGRRPIYVSPDAALRWLKPGNDAFEPRLQAVIDRYVAPGMVAWDVGANVGIFAFPTAHRSRAKVLAIEADAFSAGLLRRTCGLAENADLDVEVLCVAVGDRVGTARFKVAGRGRSASGLARGDLSSQHGATRETLTVPMLTLDSLLADFPAPDFLKVDVEGAEELLLAGAERVIEEHRPIILIEVQGNTWPLVSRTLLDQGYTLIDGDAPIDEQKPAHPETCNLLAIPPA
jgi:FkbM family methyltransferase